MDNEPTTTFPTVSVLMPVYNTPENWLREAIDSILHQTYGDFELLLGDDCSTDPHVKEVIDSYTDPRIRYIRNERNTGCAGMANVLFREARGRFWARLDSDDTAMPRRLEKQVAFLEAHPEVGVCSSWFTHMDTGEVIRIPEDDLSLRQELCMSCVMCNGSLMYRASVMREHAIQYDPEFPKSDDWALLRRLMRITRLGAVQEPLFAFRPSANSMSRSNKKVMLKDAYILQQRIRRENPEAWNALRDRMTTVTRYRLFGLIPILTVTRCGNVSTGRLFSCITLWTSRDKFRI